MYLLTYVNTTSNKAIAEFGFTDYIFKRRAFLRKQDDIKGLFLMKVGYRYFWKCLTKKISYEKV